MAVTDDEDMDGSGLEKTVPFNSSVIEIVCFDV